MSQSPARPDPRPRRTPAAPKQPRRGFLPITTNLWDRFFISMVCLVAIHLLWLRFVEQPLQAILPHPYALLTATVISIALGYVIITRG